MTSIQLVESKQGFTLAAVEPAQRINYFIALGKAIYTRDDFLGRALGMNVPLWAVYVWESKTKRFPKRPARIELLDAEATEEEARQTFKQMVEFYQEDWTAIAQTYRTNEPHVSLPVKPPTIEPGDKLSAGDRRLLDLAQREARVRQARFKALRQIMPRTAQLVEQSERVTDPVERTRLQQEAIESFFAENASTWSEANLKAWQRNNPVGKKWLAWMHNWAKRKKRRVRNLSRVDFELAFNWEFKSYDRLTLKELAAELLKVTGIKMTPAAVKERRNRLGLISEDRHGPKPRV